MRRCSQNRENAALITINAKKFVLAMGGIENSRLLLWLAKLYGNTLFDDFTPIGKYWMEHPHFTLGRAIVDRAMSDNNFYSLTAEAQINRQIFNCGFRLETQRFEGTKKIIRELMCVAPALGERMASLANKKLVCAVTFKAAWEQAPEISNQVSLSEARDRFGIPRVNLLWKKNELDRRTIVESVDAFNKLIMGNNLGRIQLDAWMLDDGEYPLNDELAGYHHMGGTRMSISSKYGVVDKNCKVFGSDNLYVAGSSIFTTGGHNNPTLPIVQFSLRLKDHLLSLM
ncbi:hypothetical protein IYY11_04370 [Methylocystis sp. H62]|uniref:GMC family oxidoreductase n=1 Tax=Methylocystis sp. H62 TaxID=2785789 RepID=UPI0018C2C2D8|nr:GMC oxidoreductase [Methylocystis sp. H62]MBG0792660.1 hypothetical protein [Methylocystis sp. H62]